MMGIIHIIMFVYFTAATTHASDQVTDQSTLPGSTSRTSVHRVTRPTPPTKAHKVANLANESIDKREPFQHNEGRLNNINNTISTLDQILSFTTNIPNNREKELSNSTKSTKKYPESEHDFIHRMALDINATRSLSDNGITTIARLIEAIETSTQINTPQNNAQSNITTQNPIGTTPVFQSTTALHKFFVSKKPLLKSTIPQVNESSMQPNLSPSAQTASTTDTLQNRNASISTRETVALDGEVTLSASEEGQSLSARMHTASGTPLAQVSSSGGASPHDAPVTLMPFAKPTPANVVTKPNKQNVTKVRAGDSGVITQHPSTNNPLNSATSAVGVPNRVTPAPKPTPRGKIMADLDSENTPTVVVPTEQPIAESPTTSIDLDPESGTKHTTTLRPDTTGGTDVSALSSDVTVVEYDFTASDNTGQPDKVVASTQQLETANISEQLSETVEPTSVPTVTELTHSMNIDQHTDLETDLQTESTAVSGEKLETSAPQIAERVPFPTSESHDDLSQASATADDMWDYFLHHKSEIHHEHEIDSKTTQISDYKETISRFAYETSSVPTTTTVNMNVTDAILPILTVRKTTHVMSTANQNLPNINGGASQSTASLHKSTAVSWGKLTSDLSTIKSTEMSLTKSILWTKLFGKSTLPGENIINEATLSSKSATTIPTTTQRLTLTPTLSGSVSTTPGKPFLISLKPKPKPTPFYSKTKPNEIFAGGNTLGAPKPTEYHVTSPLLYVRFFFRMTLLDLCQRRTRLKDIIARVVIQELSSADTVVDTTQVVCKPLDDQCLLRGWRSKRDIKSLRVDTYISDTNGAYSFTLTNVLALATQQTGKSVFTDSYFNGKVTEMKIFGSVETAKPETVLVTIDNKTRRVNVGAIVGIVFGCLVLLAVIAFLGLVMTTRWRRRGMKQMRHVTASARPSISSDTHSLAESIQMQAFQRRGSTRYGFANPSMDFQSDETELTSNLLNFEDIEQLLKRSEIIEDEFLMLPNNLSTISELPQDTEDKNRYANVIPKPETRVPLEINVKEGATSYINANFIKGYQGYPKCYIATQGPLENTVYDFWRMVWQQNTSIIVMLTSLTENNIEKCKEYWPNTEGGDTTRLYGEFRISQERRIVMPEWIQTTLQLKYKKAKQQKQIEHFWLTSWPNHGLPDYRTLIKFMVKIRPFMDDSAAPPVVHCSPGTGRTGVFIALDISMLSYEDTGMINVLNTVHEMRKDRGGMVQTKHQYAFLYKVLYEFAKMLNNPVSSARSSMTSTTSSFKFPGADWGQSING